jgi:hypothetical protein
MMGTWEQLEPAKLDSGFHLRFLEGQSQSSPGWLNHHGLNGLILVQITCLTKAHFLAQINKVCCCVKTSYINPSILKTSGEFLVTCPFYAPKSSQAARLNALQRVLHEWGMSRGPRFGELPCGVLSNHPKLEPFSNETYGFVDPPF